MKLFFTYKLLLPLAIFLAIMPPGSPHLLEKTRMLTAGTLTRPLDVFDLFWHAWPLILLGTKIGRDLGSRLMPVKRR